MRKPITPSTPQEWVLEQRAFQAANSDETPDWVKKIVMDLWEEVVAREPEHEN